MAKELDYDIVGDAMMIADNFPPGFGLGGGPQPAEAGEEAPQVIPNSIGGGGGGNGSLPVIPMSLDGSEPEQTAIFEHAEESGDPNILRKAGNFIMGAAEKSWETIRDLAGNPKGFDELSEDEQRAYRKHFWQRLAFMFPEEYGSVAAAMIAGMDKEDDRKAAAKLAEEQRTLQREQLEQQTQNKAWDTLKQEQSNLHTRMAGNSNRLGELYSSLSSEENPDVRAAIEEQIEEVQRQISLDQKDMKKVSELMNSTQAPEYYLRRSDRTRSDKEKEIMMEKKNAVANESLHPIYAEAAALIQGDEIKRLKPSDIDKALGKLKNNDERFKNLDYKSLVPFLNEVQQVNIKNYEDKLSHKGINLDIKSKEQNIESNNLRGLILESEANARVADDSMKAEFYNSNPPFNEGNIAFLAGIDKEFSDSSGISGSSLSGMAASALQNLLGQGKLKAQYEAAIKRGKLRFPKKVKASDL
jgi:hypothetical protein